MSTATKTRRTQRSSTPRSMAVSFCTLLVLCALVVQTTAYNCEDEPNPIWFTVFLIVYVVWCVASIGLALVPHPDERPAKRLSKKISTHCSHDFYSHDHRITSRSAHNGLIHCACSGWSKSLIGDDLQLETPFCGALSCISYVTLCHLVCRPMTFLQHLPSSCVLSARLF